MIRRRTAVALLAAAAALYASPPVSAQDWAAAGYRYRRPITLSNTAPTQIPAGDIVAFTYAPGFGGTLGDFSQADGRDAKIYYYNGTTNVELPQYQFSMGLSSKILFPLQQPVAAATIPPAVTENTNAGTTAYASLPAGTKLTALNGQDDSATVVAIPFAFPFKGATYNEITVATDGFFKLGNTTYNNRPDSVGALAGLTAFAPFSSDFAVTDAAAGVWVDTSNPDQVTIRWEVNESASGPVIAKFAAILYKNGTIRFVYGSPAASPSAGIAGSGGYWPLVYGAGVGNPMQSVVHQPTFPVNFANHADILYSFDFTTAPTYPQATGYWVYYGNPADTGARTPLPAGKVLRYDFATGTEGWVVPSGLNAKEPATLTWVQKTNENDGYLELTSNDAGGHPMAIAAGQTILLGEQTVYGRFKPTGGSNEAALFARATDAASGYGLTIDGFGSSEAIFGRTGPGNPNDYNTLGSGISYVADPSIWHYGVLKASGTGQDILLQGKAFPDGALDPGQWQVMGLPRLNPNPAMLIDSGQAGFGGWVSGGNKPQLDWQVITTSHAEDFLTSLGAQVEQATGGRALVQGVVTDAASGALLPGATVTLTPTTGAAVTATTNSYGRYFAFVTAGSYTVSASAAEHQTGSVSNVTATANATQTTNVALTATGTPTVPTFFGIVQSATGERAGNVTVGAAPNTRNGLADAVASAITDILGRFSLSFTPEPGVTYNAQAWRNGTLAGPNAPIVDPLTPINLTYSNTPTVNIAAGALSGTSIDTDAGNPASNLTDINDASRWSTGGMDPVTPQWFWVDLGSTVDFSQVAQVSLLWEIARPDAYQIRVGTTDPRSLTQAQAAAYGTVVYDAPAGTGRGSVRIDTNTSARPDVVTNDTLGNASGRYMLVYMSAVSPGLGNFSIYNVKVEVPTRVVSGRVFNQAGQPIANAAVGVFPNGTVYAKTDASGNYSASLPIGVPLRAHATSNNAAEVFPLSAAVTITATGPASANFIVPNAVPNLVPKNANVNGPESDTGYTLGAITDYDFATRWVTPSLPAGSRPTPTNPMMIEVDLGAPKTFNQMVIHWENARPGAYSVVLEPFGENRTIYANAGATAGYRDESTGILRFVDVVQFPEAITAQNVDIVVTQAGPIADRISIWELQLANVATTNLPVPPQPADVVRILQIAGGLSAAANTAEVTRLDQNADNALTLLDAVALARKLNG